MAISFWLLAPYVAIESIRNLLTRETPQTTLLGIGLTISSLLLMPALGIAKQRLGNRLSSGATAGEGAQNLLCAYLAGAVLDQLGKQLEESRFRVIACDQAAGFLDQLLYSSYDNEDGSERVGP